MVPRIAITTALLLAFCVSNAVASIHVTWGYIAPDPPPNLTGYRLYHNGTAVQDWLNPLLRDGDADISPEVLDSFTLTALFDDGSESPHSAPYIWTEGATVIVFGRWVWIFKPTNKDVQVGGTGKTGARIR